MATPRGLVEVTEVMKVSFAPPARRPLDFLWKYRDPGRDGDMANLPVDRVQRLGLHALPVDPASAGSGGRKPVDADVVEHLVARERLVGVSAVIGPRPELVSDPGAESGGGNHPRATRSSRRGGLG